MRRILLYSNTGRSLLLRKDLIKELTKDFEVHVLSKKDSSTKQLSQLPIHVHSIFLREHSKNPFSELVTFVCTFYMLLKLRPHRLCTFTIKPVLYGGICSRLLRIPTIPNITGLGTLFETQSKLLVCIKIIYRYALRQTDAVLFQNNESRELFVKEKIVREKQAIRIYGSGADLDRYRYSDKFPKKITFLFVGRLLESKGILDFLAAAKEIKGKYPKVLFKVIGELGEHTPGAISQDVLNTYRDVIEHVVWSDDLVPHFINTSWTVFPSYYPEGVPRILIESIATGRPVITADSSGCRDVVTQDTGFLVPPKSPASLASVIERCINMGGDTYKGYSLSARKHAEKYFDQTDIFTIYKNLLQK